MEDEVFDAVIIGGGNKGLLLAMYLMKYGGISVGVFERRHEVGGGLSTEESAAPGFRSNTHAHMMMAMYYLPIWRDFPEFWDYGCRWDQSLCSAGIVFQNNETALSIYSLKHDPLQERTAQQIARFSKRDAATWLRLAALERSREYWRVQTDMIFNPAEFRANPDIMNRQMELFPKLMEAGFTPDPLVLNASSKRMIGEWFESPELQSCILRFAVTSVNDINEPGWGIMAMGLASYLPLIGFIPGGTHQIAHASHKMLVKMGCKFFTHSEVDKVIIENGWARGIHLTDGRRVKANKIVVSAGLTPCQLCFDLIGREHIDSVLATRIELLEEKFGCVMNYSFAVHEAPKYKAETFNPDIHYCGWMGMEPHASIDRIAAECMQIKMGQWPSPADYVPAVGCNSLVDPAYAPPGKHIVQSEQLAPRVTNHTEEEWLEIKDRYADDLIRIWQQYAPNMTWDNIIGMDTNSPYDNLRMKNLAPYGNTAGVDRNYWQVDANRPTPELANHRTPIKNLYATGACWHLGSSAGSSESYNCYKIIAKDFNLAKPWEEPGKKEPDSLVDVLLSIKKKVQDSVPPEKSV
jgi:phytoene dehydrogenase-like protein